MYDCYMSAIKGSDHFAVAFIPIQIGVKFTIIKRGIKWHLLKLRQDIDIQCAVYSVELHVFIIISLFECTKKEPLC